MRRRIRSWLTRALATVGFVPIAEVERERRRTRAVRDAERSRREHERERAGEELTEARNKLQQARDKLQQARDRLRDLRARHEQQTDRLAAVTTNLDAVRSKTDRLKRALDGPQEHLWSLLAVRARIMREAGPEAAPLRSPEVESAFASACERWSAGDRPEGTRQVSVAGLTISVPADQGHPESLSGRILAGWLPIEDIARVRPFVVGGAMLDIGANIGTTCIPRVVLGDFATAYAAEPDESNYRCLVGNIVDNGLTTRVIADRVAISSSNGTARLGRSGKIGSHRLVGSVTDRPTEEVSCYTVDSWLTRLGVAPAEVAFVKVDVEGWDVRVLEGAERLLGRRQAVWQIEISPRLMASAGSTPEDLVGLVSSRFTHLLVLRSLTAPAPSTSLPELLDSMQGKGKMNLLLWNVTG